VVAPKWARAVSHNLSQKIDAETIIAAKAMQFVIVQRE